MRFILLTDRRALDPIQHAVTAVSQDIERSTLIDAHVADASELIAEKMLLGENAVVAERQLHHHLAAKCTDPHFRLRWTGRDAQRAGSNRNRHPVADREHRAWGFAVHRDGTSRIVDTISCDRPAVVPAALDEVELVAPLRPMLVGPELARRRVINESLRIAMAVAPDLRSRARHVAERIILRNRSIDLDAHDFSRRV